MTAAAPSLELLERLAEKLVDWSSDMPDRAFSDLSDGIEATRAALQADPVAVDGPYFEDGCSREGYVGGCERMGCHSFDAWHDAKWPEPVNYAHRVAWRARKRERQDVWNAALTTPPTDALPADRASDEDAAIGRAVKQQAGFRLAMQQRNRTVAPRQIHNDPTLTVLQQLIAQGRVATNKPTDEAPTTGDYLDAAIERLSKAVSANKGSTVTITKADACFIGRWLQTIPKPTTDEAPGKGGWLPIESIPQDGTEVELLSANGKTDRGQWYVFADWTEPSDDVQDHLSTDNGEGNYTHWRPLTSPDATP